MSDIEIEVIKQKLVLFEEMFRDMKMAIVELEREVEMLRADNEDNIEALEDKIDEKAIDVKRDLVDDIIERLRTI